MCLRLVDLFVFHSICSILKEHSLCSTPTWCSFLPCLVSITQRPVSEKILWKVPSSRSGIALRFGAHPQLSVPMLRSLLFSQVQNNMARFHHQSPVHHDALGHKWYILRSAAEFVTLSLFCWSVKIWGIHLTHTCGSQACYAVCWIHSLMKCSRCWLFSRLKYPRIWQIQFGWVGGGRHVYTCSCKQTQQPGSHPISICIGLCMKTCGHGSQLFGVQSTWKILKELVKGLSW